MPRLTDADLAKLGKAYKKAQNAVKAAMDKQDRLKLRLLNEMARRGSNAVEHSGVRVSLAQGHTTTYDLEYFKQVVPRRQQPRIIKESPDAEGIRLLVEEGVISMDQLARGTTTQPKAAYPVVSVNDD